MRNKFDFDSKRKVIWMLFWKERYSPADTIILKWHSSFWPTKNMVKNKESLLEDHFQLKQRTKSFRWRVILTGHFVDGSFTGSFVDGPCHSPPLLEWQRSCTRFKREKNGFENWIIRIESREIFEIDWLCKTQPHQNSASIKTQDDNSKITSPIWTLVTKWYSLFNFEIILDHFLLFFRTKFWRWNRRLLCSLRIHLCLFHERTSGVISKASIVAVVKRQIFRKTSRRCNVFVSLFFSTIWSAFLCEIGREMAYRNNGIHYARVRWTKCNWERFHPLYKHTPCVVTEILLLLLAHRWWECDALPYRFRSLLWQQQNTKSSNPWPITASAIFNNLTTHIANSIHCTRLGTRSEPLVQRGRL